MFTVLSPDPDSPCCRSTQGFTVVSSHTVRSHKGEQSLIDVEVRCVFQQVSQKSPVKVGGRRSYWGRSNFPSVNLELFQNSTKRTGFVQLQPFQIDLSRRFSIATGLASSRRAGQRWMGETWRRWLSVLLGFGRPISVRLRRPPVMCTAKLCTRCVYFLP